MSEIQTVHCKWTERPITELYLVRFVKPNVRFLALDCITFLWNSLGLHSVWNVFRFQTENNVRNLNDSSFIHCLKIEPFGNGHFLVSKIQTFRFWMFTVLASSFPTLQTTSVGKPEANGPIPNSKYSKRLKTERSVWKTEQDKVLISDRKKCPKSEQKYSFFRHFISLDHFRYKKK